MDSRRSHADSRPIVVKEEAFPFLIIVLQSAQTALLQSVLQHSTMSSPLNAVRASPLAAKPSGIYRWHSFCSLFSASSNVNSYLLTGSSSVDQDASEEEYQERYPILFDGVRCIRDR